MDRESQCPASLVLLTRRDTPQLLPRQGPFGVLGSPRWIPLDPEAREHRPGARGPGPGASLAQLCCVAWRTPMCPWAYRR